MDRLGATTTVVCPAYPPTAARSTRVISLWGPAPVRVVDGPPPVDADDGSRLVRFLGRQTQRGIGLVLTRSCARGRRDSGPAARTRGARASYAVTDALVDADLRAIGTASAGLGLVTGGSGVALGLPDNFRRSGHLRAGAERAKVPFPTDRWSCSPAAARPQPGPRWSGCRLAIRRSSWTFSRPKRVPGPRFGDGAGRGSPG